VSGQVSEGVGGPVAIYTYSGLAVRAGIMIFFQFIALLSLNLAIINILPFPALDGGRLLFILLEKIRGGKVVRENVENIIHTVGFILLIALMIALTYRDLIKLF
jgi:regulator of sigma E protease